MVITNIVITCNLTTTVFLPIMAKHYPWTEWNRKKFAALTLRFKSPKTTCLVFASGRIVCTGGNTMAAARLSVLQACRMVNECGYPDARVKDFAVQNIASAYKFRATDLDLERLFLAYQAQTSYEPEVSTARRDPRGPRLTPQRPAVIPRPQLPPGPDRRRLPHLRVGAGSHHGLALGPSGRE